MEQDGVARPLEMERQNSETSHLLNMPHRSDSVSDGDKLITVDEAIENIGFGKFQLGMLMYTGLAWLADAAEMILLSFIGPSARCEWGLSAFGEGAITSAVFVGLFLGAYVWGVVADIKGRRLGFCATALFTFLFGLLSAWSPAYWFLLLSRALVGFGLGGASVVFSLCMEFLPSSSRGFWLVFMEVLWTVGSVASALLAWLILPHHSWRLLIAVSALPFLLLLIFYPILPESPRYLMVKGDSEGAWKILKQVAKVNGVAVPSGTLTLAKSSCQAGKNKEDHLARVVSTAAGSTRNFSLGGALKVFLQLFSPQLKVTTCLLWTFFFANAFTYYGLVLLTTQLPIKEHEKSFVAASGCLPDGRPGTDVSSYKAVLITSLAELPGLVVACLIVDWFGRKASMGVLLLGCGLFVIPLWTPLSETATTTLMFGARSCIMGAFSILWAFAPELYPTNVRTTGLGFCNAGGRVGGFFCPFVAVEMMKNNHRVLAVTFFAAVPIITSMATFLFPVETKGQSLADDVQVEKPVNHSLRFREGLREQIMEVADKRLQAETWQLMSNVMLSIMMVTIFMLTLIWFLFFLPLQVREPDIDKQAESFLEQQHYCH